MLKFLNNHICSLTFVSKCSIRDEKMVNIGLIRFVTVLKRQLPGLSYTPRNHGHFDLVGNLWISLFQSSFFLSIEMDNLNSSRMWKNHGRFSLFNHIR